MTNLTIGFDAKRTVRNATGLGNYCRTLLNDLGSIDHTDSLRLYVPDLGRDDLRSQLNMQQNMQFVLPTNTPKLLKGLWRIRNIVNDLKRDNVEWQNVLFILHATRALVFLSSKPYRADCLWWLAQVAVWKRLVVLTTYM